jgi:hypothetical protein
MTTTYELWRSRSATPVKAILFLALSTVLACGEQVVGWTSPDETAPTVSSTTPTHDATNVGLNTTMVATFSEAMDPLSITASTFTLMHGTTTVTGEVNYTGLTALFVPARRLALDTVYTATIMAAVTDVAGNAMGANYTWSFTTGSTPDETPPLVIATSPASGTVDVARGASVTATFNEAIDPLTISETSFTLSNGTALLTGTVSYVGVTATFNPDADLEANTIYVGTILSDVTDLAGNELEENYVWLFATGVAPDTTAPTVVATIPAPGAMNVMLNALVTATFSETMNATTISSSTFTLLDGVTPIDGAVTYTGLVATL